MRYLLLSFALLQCNMLVAQVPASFAPAGAEWHFGFNNPGLLQARGYRHYQYVGDTLIQGKTAKALHLSEVLFPYNGPNIPTDTSDFGQEYFLVHSDSVSVWRNGTFRFLWRTNVAAGQKFYYDTGYGIIFEMLVDSVKTVKFNDQDVKKLWITGNANHGLSSGKTVIYDRFGPENSFLYFQCWGAFDCFESTLCRYIDDEFPQVVFTGSKCDVLTSSTDPGTVAPAIRVYPNPASAEVVFEMQTTLEKAEVRLFSHDGVLLRIVNQEYGNSIRMIISDLPVGIYFYQFLTGQSLSCGKFVKN